jgi:predicted TPR repeat methyltransferase
MTLRDVPLFRSSGDLIADRRYDHAMALRARGDLAAAADLMRQATELAPNFAAAWFALGEMEEQLGRPGAAVAAFRRARAADPADGYGAGLHLARLEAGEADAAMTPAYVRGLFDQYAPRFDAALAALSYAAPALLVAAVEAACSAQGRRLRFGTTLDLGCGTGLAGAAFRPFVDWLVGVDLSPAMIAQARAKGLYDALHVADLGDFLGREGERNAEFHLIVAADVFVYVADLDPAIAAAARVLAPGGMLAFTVETHDGDGVALGEKLRFVHGRAHVRDAIGKAGLTLLALEDASTRTENNAPVPGLLAIASRATTSAA